MAILAKLPLTEQAELEFGLDVFGTHEKPSRIRFVIEGAQFDVSCHCEETVDGIKVKIPKLKNILTAGVFESYLSVEIDGKIFKPLQESIEFNQLIEMDVKKKRIESVKEGVKVTAKNIKVVSEDSRDKLTGLEKNLQSAIKEGYEVSKIGDNYVMKKGDLYAGLISETAILKSKKLQSSITELVDSFTKE